MATPKRRSGGLRQAIRRELQTRGLQAKAEHIAAAVASYGLEVSSELVNSVRVEMLKQRGRVERVERSALAARKPQGPKRLPSKRKIPQKRPRRDGG